jgi:hypothetical protein
MSTELDWLCCDHCGDDAICSDAEGRFYDGDGGKCATCGFPGWVSVDDGGSEDPTARWAVSEADDARCTVADCAGCARPNAEETK